MYSVSTCDMETIESDQLSKNVWTYFKKRHYIDNGEVVTPDLVAPIDEIIMSATVDKDTSHHNNVTYSSCVSDVSQAELQFSTLKTWLQDPEEESIGKELVPLLMPLLCHTYLEALRTSYRAACTKFLKRYLVPPLSNPEWHPLVDQLLAVHSPHDIETQPLVMAFRSTKYEFKLSPRSLTRLKKFLAAKGLNIIIQVLQSWFELAANSDDSPSLEDDIMANNVPNNDIANEELESLFAPSPASTDGPSLNGVDDDEDEDVIEDPYIDVRDSEMKKLLRAINEMRAHPTPPPPLLLYTVHKTEGIVCGRLSEDLKLAATGDHNSEVRVWGLQETKFTPQLHPSYFSSVPLSAYTEYDHEELLKAENDRQWWSLRGHSDTVYDVTFTQDSDFLLSISFDTTMRLWKVSDYSCSAIYRGHVSPLWSVSVSNVHNMVATASSDRTARVWNLDRTFPLRILAGHQQDVMCVGWHPNGSYLATGSLDRTVRLWSVTDGSLVRIFGTLPNQGTVHSLSFSPNGHYLASGGDDGTIWMWDIAGGGLVYQLPSHLGGRVVSVDWSLDGSMLSAACHDGTIYHWSLDPSSLCCEEGPKPIRYETKCPTLLSLQYSTKNTLVAVGLT